MVETPAWPSISQGQKGTNVKALKCPLNYHGAGIGVDGDFGLNAYNAVLNYQAKNGLSVKNGVADKNTLPKLIITVSSRMINDAAWAAQTLHAKFESLAVDNDFWSGSETATKNFQTKMGFATSSITSTVAPITWRYLFG